MKTYKIESTSGFLPYTVFYMLFESDPDRFILEGYKVTQI